MNSLMKMYNEVVEKVKSVSEQIHTIEQEIVDLRNGKDSEISARIAKLEEQLIKIDEYVLAIKGIQELAKKNLESQNVLTIEAPPGYRVNMNRLRKWAAMIDPTSANDPYAQRVLAVAKCDECFLEQKREEFTAKLMKLKERGDGDVGYKISGLEAYVYNLKEEINTFAYSEKVYQFAEAVLEANERFWFEKVPMYYHNNVSQSNSFAPGAYAESFPFDTIHKEWFKNRFGKFYDSENKRVLLPAEIALDKEFVITISCAPTKDKSLDKGIQNLILNIINNSMAGLQTVYVIDGVRFNTSSVGTLRQLENTFALGQIPRNAEQITTVLEKIVSSFADIDEILDDCDSVKLFNSTIATDDSKKIPLTTIILYGWPNAYEGRNKELLTKIMTNYERYGISFVTISYKKEEKIDEEVQNALPEYATHNAIHIRMFPNDTTIRMPEESPKKFVWYVLNEALPKEYAQSLKEHTIEKNVIGSEYIKRYSLETYPIYKKGKKSISLPFGVDAKDQAHEISFDNENFAAYLMGASGSGKSTLLHTLITGIIRNYHPDDVELWLADFKMSEFAQYMNPRPPHVKYILLDESPELVYDLLDKLTEKMMERQRFFMQNRNLKKVENVKNVYMPIIFVILDEFSIMSQAVAESPVYKLKLQNLLAKGRALGIKFIFASQDFSKGINGLTATAKDQIQSRIAMKNTVSEINETLELSINMKTDQVRNWMEAIPPYYALLKYRDDEQVYVKRVNVMYFKGNGDSAYEPQRKLIEQLNATIRPVSTFNPIDTTEYVDKDPVLVDGNSYDAFEVETIRKRIESFKENKDFSGDEIFTYAGTPRLMTKYKEFVITPEARQNFLLICDSSEYNCGTAVVTSLIKSFTLQKQKIAIWGYGRNKILKMARDSVWKDYEVISEMERICSAIRNLKERIQNDEVDEGVLIVLLGFENICADFEFMSETTTKKNTATNKAAAMETMSEKLEEDMGALQADISNESEEEAEMRRLFLKSIATEEEEEEEDNSEFMDVDDIERLIELEMKAMLAGMENETEISKPKDSLKKADTVLEAETVKTSVKIVEEKEEVLLYNAKADLKYIIQHGSRKGIHFLLYLNSYADLKITGLREELFRHRLAFSIPSEDSKMLFGNSSASSLPQHICIYTDMIERFSFRPYLHQGISWDGWSVDEYENVINPFNY